MSTVSINKKRVGTDISMKLTLKDNGVSVSWESLSEIYAYMYADDQRVMAGQVEYAIDPTDEYTLLASYGVNEPQYLGVNRIVITCVYEGQTRTYDAPVVEFVETLASEGSASVDVIDVSLTVSEVSTSLLSEAIVACVAATASCEQQTSSAAAAEALRVSAESARVAAENARQATIAAKADKSTVDALSAKVNGMDTYDVGTITIALNPEETFVKDETYGYRVYINSSNEAYVNRSASNLAYNVYGFAVKANKTYKVLAWGQGVSTGNVYGVVVTSKFGGYGSGKKQTPSLVVGANDGTSSYKSREITFVSPVDGYVYICNKATVDAYCKTDTSDDLSLKEYFEYRDEILDNLVNKMKWSSNYGKSMAIFGGSIAYNASLCRDYFSEKLGMSVDNYAIGGAGFYKATDSIQDQVDSALASGTSYDIFLFWCSTNDWSQNKAIGAKDDYIGESFAEPSDESKRLSQSGGMNYCFYKIKKANPAAQILVFTSARAFDRANGYEVFSSDSNALVRYVDAQIEVCNKWGVPYLDQFRAVEITPFTKATYLADDKHPSVTGYKYMRQLQAAFLASPIEACAAYGSVEMDIAQKINEIINDSSSGTSVEVIDNLTSTSTTSALSANQGRVLKELIDSKGTYSKPSEGIPKTDLASAVQASLSKADTALQSIPSTYRTSSAQDTIDSGKADKIIKVSSIPADGFVPNVLYKLGSITGAVTFTIASYSIDYAEYMIEFETGDTAPTITWFTGVTWLGGTAPVVSANKKYYVSVLDNLAVIGEF